MKKKEENKKLFEGVIQTLLSRIEKGKYKVGDILPPEMELCKEFGVSRFTIRNAMKSLEEWGMIERRKRAGTQVTATAPLPRYGLSLQTTTELLQYLEETDLHVVSRKKAAKRELRSILPPDSVGTWWKVETYRTPAGSDTPLSWTDIFIHDDYSGILEHIGTRPGATYTLLEEIYGEPPSVIRQELSGTLIPARMAKVLHLSAGTAVLKILRRFYNADDRLVEVAISYYPEGNFAYVIDLKRQDLLHAST